MKQSALFTIIPGVLFIVPVFLFASGFLSTFSLLSIPEHELWSVKTIWGFYKKKMLKLVPFNIFCIAFCFFVMPYIGGGPVWLNYNKTLAPCKDYWWTNVLFINNFYPAEYDQQCMGWNWFIPVYLQLNALLPFILLAYKTFPKIVTVIIFGIIAAIFFALNLALIIEKNIGVIPFFN